MTIREYNNSVGEYADSLYRFIRSNLRDEERANDIVQDTYEKLWRHVAELEYKIVKAWLFSTAYHLMIDILRREKRIFQFDMTGEEAISDESSFNDLNSILQDALKRLPEQQRSAVLLRDYEGYSYKEIGDIMGFNESQVKITIYRGRIALKNYIRKIEIVI
jgi:RNA polymerase sigma-70 factor (ECF subfamily)